jgi:hypothetical protein
MELHVEMELQGAILLVTASGTATFESALRCFKQVFDTAKEKGVSKILVNSLAANGELSTSERYELAMGIVAHVRLRGMNPRIAMVGHPPTVNGFAMRVSQNRDVSAETFSDLEQALHWLNCWRD